MVHVWEVSGDCDVGGVVLIEWTFSSSSEVFPDMCLLLPFLSSLRKESCMNGSKLFTMTCCRSFRG